MLGQFLANNHPYLLSAPNVVSPIDTAVAWLVMVTVLVSTIEFTTQWADTTPEAMPRASSPVVFTVEGNTLETAAAALLLRLQDKSIEESGVTPSGDSCAISASSAPRECRGHGLRADAIGKARRNEGIIRHCRELAEWIGYGDHQWKELVG